MMGDGIIVRRDASTKEILGFTIVDFIEHFSGNKSQRSPQENLDNILRTAVYGTVRTVV